jgi:hypothetical protein
MTEVETREFPATNPADLPERCQRPRLGRKVASEYLDLRWGIVVAPATLAKYATIGGGPKFEKVNRKVLYTPRNLDAWVMTKLGPMVDSTSQEA